MDRPYKRIACCIDRDDMAEAALREAARLADGALGALRVVHVVAPPRAVAAGPWVYAPSAGETRDEARAWLEEVTSRVPEASPVLLDGFGPREVCEWALTCGVDLIVAAAHRGLIQRTMLGGFASHLAYHAPCSLLLVHRRRAEDAVAPGSAARRAGTLT